MKDYISLLVHLCKTKNTQTNNLHKTFLAEYPIIEVEAISLAKIFDISDVRYSNMKSVLLTAKN